VRLEPSDHLHWFGLVLERLESVIAHEIAHVWLGHDPLMGDHAKEQAAAAALVTEWGFEGIGTQPSRTFGH
jgi:hypothetical protein